ncbi:MAG: hypothetical protein F2681_03550 [Actinobacteria bacterium]|nr:hypothetical protein [Actinomycetota bacterium]MSW76749.1 hypothetical protein [Actinomycetota bacterium]MSX54559.1 hypothetical protein [Actinomycetota bacterium]MSX94821.1 hypothetical protein [Actinomycetota bacterium]MSZ82196.1 hypothetical protein [Actinomycetota bacterium]
MTDTWSRKLAAAVVVAAALAACSSSHDGLATTTVASESSSSTTSVVDGSTTTTTSAPPVTDAATVPVSATPAPATTTAGPRPGAVTIVSAGSSGGSGEIEVIWNAAVGAEIYRVYRATAVGGPFIIVATVNIVTGDATVHSGVVNVYGDSQNFWPRPYHGTGMSATFHYVELDIGGGPHIYYRVVAFNSNGHGPTGATVCAQIYSQPAC